MGALFERFPLARPEMWGICEFEWPARAECREPCWICTVHNVENLGGSVRI